MRKYSILLMFLIPVMACNNAGPYPEELPGLYRFFGSANWRLVGDRDTSYIYFSNQPDHSYKTYEFTMEKGDSILRRQGRITRDKNHIIWELSGNRLSLIRLTASGTEWKDSLNAAYRLRKLGDSVLQLQTPHGYIEFRKTLPLSTFLARSKYDYLHHTHLVDSGEINPVKPGKQ